MVMKHKECMEIEDAMSLELRRQEAIIKTYKEMLLAAGVHSGILEQIARDVRIEIY